MDASRTLPSAAPAGLLCQCWRRSHEGDLRLHGSPVSSTSVMFAGTLSVNLIHNTNAVPHKECSETLMMMLQTSLNVKDDKHHHTKGIAESFYSYYLHVVVHCCGNEQAIVLQCLAGIVAQHVPVTVFTAWEAVVDPSELLRECVSSKSIYSCVK